MSLLKHIYTARDNSKRSFGWADFDTWNLATLQFQTREEAEKTYNNTRGIYDDITQHHTWEGVANQGKHPEATAVSFRHHMWIDEHDDGFFLCVSFDNGTQTRDFMNKAQQFTGDKAFKFEHFTVLQSVSDEINRYMTATHSVEVDVTGVFTAEKFGKSFEAAAQPTALYTDRVRRGDLDVTRYKAYFDSQSAAYEFASRTRGVEYRVRRFPAAKSEQPKKLQVA